MSFTMSLLRAIHASVLINSEAENMNFLREFLSKILLRLCQYGRFQRSLCGDEIKVQIQ